MFFSAAFTESLTRVLCSFYRRQHNRPCSFGTGGQAFELRTVTSDQMLLLQQQPFWVLWFYFFFFFPTSASFFQNPTFADALAPVVLLVQHAGKVKEKIFFFFLLFFLKRVRFAGVWSLAMICSQVKAWGKLEKLFRSQCRVVIGSSVLPSQLRNF